MLDDTEEDRLDLVALLHGLGFCRIGGWGGFRLLVARRRPAHTMRGRQRTMSS